jgi:putative ABC transport system permease protein
MSTLDKKLIRELWLAKGQSLAIGLVIASGVAVFVMAVGTLGFLRDTRDSYYERYRFADCFATVRRAPESVSEAILQLPMVARMQTRIVADVTLDVPRLPEPAVGRLVSLPDYGEPNLNAVYLRAGRMPELGRAGEVLANEVFAEANQLRIGDKFTAVMNGRQQVLTVVGIGLSPEYVFQLRAGDLLPDQRRFGVLWMRREQMESAFDMVGAFNDICVKLQPGTNPEAIIESLDRILKPYGAPGAYSRKDQISASFLDDEIQQLRATAIVSPSIFLGVAAFLLNIVLTRRIGTQREIIASLKAFGYTNREVGGHYLKSSLIVAGIGAIVGALAGLWLGAQMARLYSQFYRFPEFTYRGDLRLVVAGILISLLTATLGVLRSLRDIVKLHPAEAMRPATPRRFGRSIIERMGLSSWISLSGRMIVRQLERRPLNAMFSILGISFAVAIMVMGGFMSDAINYLLYFQYELAQRQDIRVSFNQVASPNATFDLGNLPGVRLTEPLRAVPVELKHGHYSYRTSILGLDPQRQLYRLLDTNIQEIRLPKGGVVLSQKLADWLHVDVGDWIDAEVLDGEQPRCKVQVVGLATEYAGMNAYMRRAALNTLLQEADVINGAFLAVDSLHLNALYRELKRTPMVAAATIKQASIRQFQETIGKNQAALQSFTLFFAGVIAVGVVYNTARISLDERSRELATLRVIGFSRWEVSSMLLGELAWLTLAAIPLGFLIGYTFCRAMVIGFETEVLRIPLVINPGSYAWAALVTIVAATLSGLLVRRRLDQLDLVEVLKTRE